MFLVLTAKSGLEDAFEITRDGAASLLVKPLSVDQLQSEVASMLH